MSTLYITEFADLATVHGSVGQIAAQPPTTEQTVTVGASSTASSAFQTNTRIVRLHTDVICSIIFGTAPTATAINARMAANQTEYFQIPSGQSWKVAVITNS